MTLFTPDSPAGRAVRNLLHKHKTGLSIWVTHLLPDLAAWLGLAGRPGHPHGPSLTTSEMKSSLPAHGFGDEQAALPSPHTLLDLEPIELFSTRTPLQDYKASTVQDHFLHLLQVKDYQERASQTRMVQYVAEAFDENRFLIIEAPTGTGKTYAYLIPAILRAGSLGRPVIVSTNTRNLQDQLIDDLTDLQKHLGLAFTFQPIKGMENYICLERLVSFIDELEASDQGDDEQRLGLLFLLRLAQS
jgi:hypothetical protein